MHELRVNGNGIGIEKVDSGIGEREIRGMTTMAQGYGGPNFLPASEVETGQALCLFPRRSNAKDWLTGSHTRPFFLFCLLQYNLPNDIPISSFLHVVSPFFFFFFFFFFLLMLL